MLTAALRDLQWRKRRFVIAIIGTSLVFAVTLALTGLVNGFRVEARRTVDSFGLDAYLIKARSAGPFLGSSPFDAAEAQRAARLPGVEGAVPFIYASTTLRDDGSPRTVNLFAAPEHGPGMPAVSHGRAPSAPDEIAVSSTLGRHPGEDLEIGSRVVRIVGVIDDSTAIANQPNVFLTIAGGQQLAYGGQPLMSSIGIRGTPAQVPDGYRAVDRRAAVDDLLRPLKSAVEALTLMAVLLWVVAALIVGSVIYLSALERTRDFAVFKAVGVTTRSVLSGLVVQAVVVAIVAAILGALLSLILAPVFPMSVVIPVPAFMLLPLIAVITGMVASVAGLRRAVTVDPALAFRGP